MSQGVQRDEEERLTPGEGLIRLCQNGQDATFAELQFSYPLKMIVPARRFFDGVGCVYVISYGGGLVARDRMKLKVEVQDGSTLVMLTQGSTKVFKTRPAGYLTDTIQFKEPESQPTRQLMTVTVAPHSSLFLLPSPVTCFSRANYSQRQSFDISSTSNLILVDWYTSGRMGMGKGEEWEFKRYRSSNEVRIDGVRVAKDVMLLEDERDDSTEGDGGKVTYLSRVLPYSCYATLVIFGPSLVPLLTHLRSAFAEITQYKQTLPYSLIWSFSELENGKGGIARCAGDSTETVRDWLREVLKKGGIEDLIGRDLWQNAFSCELKSPPSQTTFGSKLTPPHTLVESQQR